LKNYESIIRAEFDWEKLKAEALRNPHYDLEVEDDICSIFLGTVMSLTPSGKYYTPWANSNVTPNDIANDALWYEALDAVAESYDGWVESGEGDPCDLFVCWRPE
jgi:hypothetical protein